ncbi:hypothetical protein [Leptospira biflexa]|uniref:hypothetical protein n=1 Tax=Leptospira biflexa TaxID=172 RepID=UPI001FEE7BAB|nr:hypothetical protein [Leptospira biflexa]
MMAHKFLIQIIDKTLIPIYLSISLSFLFVSCVTPDADKKADAISNPNPEFEMVAGIEFSQKFLYRPWTDAQSFCLSQNLKLPSREQLLAVYHLQKYFPGDGYENSSYWTNEKNIFVYGGNALNGNDETRSSVRCVK